MLHFYANDVGPRARVPMVPMMMQILPIMPVGPVVRTCLLFVRLCELTLELNGGKRWPTLFR